MKSLEGEIDVDRLKNFSWISVTDEAGEKMPTVLNFLDALMPSVARIRPGISKGNKCTKR